MSNIKTYDGATIIQQRLDQKYPEGSLTARDIILTLPVDKDLNAQAFEINSKITKAIYQHAEEFLKSQKPETKKGFTPVSDFKAKVDDNKERIEKLSSLVIQTLSGPSISAQ